MMIMIITPPSTLILSLPDLLLHPPVLPHPSEAQKKAEEEAAAKRASRQRLKDKAKLWEGQ
jgi:hypothetical protein